MNNKEATFKILESMPDNYIFTGNDIKGIVCSQTGRQPYTATILRYIRTWRTHNRQVKCISRAKSKYMIKGKDSKIGIEQ